jgi:hypothetical protein
MDKTYGKVDPQLLKGLSDHQKNSVLNWESYQQFQQAMNEIIWQMKEIPVLPSSIPPEDDRFVLTKVEMPNEGGVLTYMDKFLMPYEGFPYQDFVNSLDIVKKIIKGTLSGFYHSFRGWSFFKVIPMIVVARNLIYVGTYTFGRLIERHRIKPFRYSTAIRELHRAFTFPSGKSVELRLMIRDVICMLLEFDNAYRFRAQDLLVEIDKSKLKKNPIKELKRVADIAIGREREQQVKDTWKLIKMFCSYYLRFDRQLRSMIVEVLLELNYEQFKLKPADIQFCTPRKDYVFGYMK